MFRNIFHSYHCLGSSIVRTLISTVFRCVLTENCLSRSLLNRLIRLYHINFGFVNHFSSLFAGRPLFSAPRKKADRKYPRGLLLLLPRIPPKGRAGTIQFYLNTFFRNGMPFSAIASGDSANGRHTDAAFAISLQSGVKDSIRQ